jgi:hypothetical protein
MSKIINTDLPAQRRNKLLRFISSCLLLLQDQPPSKKDQNDLIAFIILSLAEIEKTITQSTAPWERRDYWVKADQLRSEWGWAAEVKNHLMRCKTSQGWTRIPLEIQLLKEKIKDVKPLKRIGDDFWKNAYSALLKQK